MSIAENLQRILADQGITQTELAKRLGVTSQAVSQWVSGASTPRGTRIRAIADALRVPANLVLPEDDPIVEKQAIERLRSSINPGWGMKSLRQRSMVSEADILDVLNGNVHGRKLRVMLSNLEAALDLPADYLYYGDSTGSESESEVDKLKPKTPEMMLEQASNFSTGGQCSRTMPVWGTAEGGDNGTMCLTMGASDLAVDWIVRPKVVENVREAFGLYVVESSMEPRWMPGELLIVNPFRPARAGDPILIVLRTAGDRDVKHVLFKRLVRRSPSRLSVGQTNPTKEFEIPMDEVEHVWRIYEWGELLSGLSG